MKLIELLRIAFVVLLLGLGGVSLTACQTDGAFEEAGEEIDETADEVEDEIDD